MRIKLTSILPNQFLTLLRNGSQVLSEDDQVTAIGWLTQQIKDPYIKRKILASVDPPMRAMIESQIAFNNQVRQNVYNYGTLLQGLDDVYREYYMKDYRKENPPYGREFSGTEFDKYTEMRIRERSSRLNFSPFIGFGEGGVEANKVNYLLAGSFRSISKTDLEKLKFLIPIFGYLQHHLEGFEVKMNLNDLKEYCAMNFGMKEFTGNEHDQQLLTLLERAKEVVGLVPFPANIE